MFKYKTQKELSELSETEVDAYMADKKKHENAQRKQEIDAAVKAAQDALEGKFKTQVEDLTEQIGKIKENSFVDDSIKKGSFVKFVKEIVESKSYEKRDHSANHVIKVAALMTTANVTPNVAGGFSPLFGNYIDTEIGQVPKPDNIIMPLITVVNQPGTESIWYSDRVNEDGDAAFIAEGSLKPLIDAEWATAKAPIKEVALRWKMTKRLMMHAPSIVLDFAEHANQLVEQKIDDRLLDGVEDAENFNGLQAVASAFIVPTGLAAYYPQANIYDAIMAIATQIRLANFKGQLTAILNTVWMAKMAGIKDLEGRYIIAPFVTPDGKNIGEVQVVFSNKILATDVVVGDLKKFKLVMAEDVMYDEGYENDDFSKNLVSKKLEAFMGTYLKSSDAGSIVFDQIASVLTDIEVPVV